VTLAFVDILETPEGYYQRSLFTTEIKAIGINNTILVVEFSVAAQKLS
jgi:hypothetical protein